MFLNWTKNFIFKNNLVLKTLSVLPERFLFHKMYFDIIALNKKYEKDEDKNAVRMVLRKQLMFVLRNSLRNVKYYRENIRINPNDINEENVYDMLLKFPYLNKKTIMANKQDFVDERISRFALHYGTSGGSTGQGVGIFRTKKEYDIEKAFFKYEWGKYGFSQFKSRIIKIGTEARRNSDEDPLRFIGNRLLISPYHLNMEWIEKIYDSFMKFQAEFIDTYPSCLEYIARYIQETKKNCPKFKCIFLGSEMVTDYQYDLFKQVFDSPIKISYGLTERTNFAFSYDVQSDDKFYYKLNDIYGYSENRENSFGEFEIVGTSYWNIAMPLIRYCTQDYGKIENGIIKKIDGRNQEFLIGKRGERIPGFSLKVDEFTWDFVDIYQVVQNEKGKLVLKIVPKVNFTNEISKSLLDKQVERWGGFFDMSIDVVDSIERTKSGKLRLIVNNIGLTK